MYDVTPQGRRYYAEMKRRGGEAALVVDKEIRSFLDGKAFMHSFPDAYDRWHQAEQGLWDADNPADMTRIGPMPLSLFYSRRDAGLCPGEGWIDEFDGGGGVVPGAVLAGLLDLVGVVPGALDDAGIGALAPLAQVPGAGDLGDGAFEGTPLIRGEKPGRRPGGG